MITNPQTPLSQVHFTEAEASSLIGSRIETGSAFSSIPSGTCGVVKGMKGIEGGYAVTVEWDRPKRQKLYYATFLDLSFNLSLFRSDPPRTHVLTKSQFLRLSKSAGFPKEEG